MEIRWSGKSPGVWRCGQKRMGSRTDRLPASGAADWDYQGVCRERFVTKTGGCIAHSAGLRMSGRVCPDMQNRADCHRRRENQPVFGARCISRHAQTVETVAETAKCCGIRRVVYVRACTTLGESSCGAAVPRWMPHILCAAADAT